MRTRDQVLVTERPLRKKIFIFLFSSFILGQFFSASIYAQTPLPFDELGAGPRANAMGQAFTALADNPFAAYYNPAGLNQIDAPFSLTLGYQYAKPKVRVKFDIKPVQNPALGTITYDREEDLSTRGLCLGLAADFSKVSAFSGSAIARRVAFGFALLANLPEYNQFDNPQRPENPYLFKFTERWSLIAMAISIGVELTDWLSLGGGIIPRVDAYQNSQGSWIDMSGVGDPNDRAGGFRSDFRIGTRLNAVPTGGILIKPPIRRLKKVFSLGACYRGEVWGFYGTGYTQISLFEKNEGQDPNLIYYVPRGRIVNFVGFSPAQLSAGLAVKPWQGLTFTGGITFKWYSKFHFFWDLVPFDRDETGAKYENPFDDVWVCRLGMEYGFDPDLTLGYLKKVTQISIQAGYYFEPSPVPDMNGPMNILDSDQDVVSGGFGIEYDAQWTGVVKLEVFFQSHFFRRNRLNNDRDALFGPITVSGAVYNTGVALSIVY